MVASILVNLVNVAISISRVIISTQSYPALTNSGHLILAELAFWMIIIHSWGTISRHYEDQEGSQLHVNLVNDK